MWLDFQDRENQSRGCNHSRFLSDTNATLCKRSPHSRYCPDPRHPPYFDPSALYPIGFDSLHSLALDSSFLKTFGSLTGEGVVVDPFDLFDLFELQGATDCITNLEEPSSSCPLRSGFPFQRNDAKWKNDRRAKVRLLKSWDEGIEDEGLRWI